MAADVLAKLKQLPSAVQTVLNDESRLERLAAEYADNDAILFVDHGSATPVARESALRLKEISYGYTEVFAAEELNIALPAFVIPETPAIAFLTAFSSQRDSLKQHQRSRSTW